MKELRAVIVENANFSPFEPGWTQKNRLCSYSTTSYMALIHLASLKPRLYRGGMLDAMENHKYGACVLPIDSDNPTDLAGYPSIDISLGFEPADISADYATPHPVDHGSNVPRVSHGICLGCHKANVFEPATVFR